MRFIAVLAGAAAVLLVAAPAYGGSDAASPQIRAVDSAVPYFDLALAPGESVEVAVEMANPNAAPVAAKTYLADVYSLINGGLGVAAAEHAASNGATDWLMYRSAEWTMPAESVERRPVRIEVPADARPGSTSPRSSWRMLNPFASVVRAASSSTRCSARQSLWRL